MFLESHGLEVWDTVEEWPFIPTNNVEGVEQPKHKKSWSENDKKKTIYDKKAKNILASTLGVDEFFRVSNYKMAKEIWDTLETTQEGTKELKRSILNTFSQEYKMFRILPVKIILDMQERLSTWQII